MFLLLAYQHALVTFKAVVINLWAMTPLATPISKYICFPFIAVAKLQL